MRRDLLISLALAIATFGLYAQVRHFEFINFDDTMYVTDNDRVLSGLSWENVVWSFTSLKAANWHPLAWLSHMLDAQLYGKDPGGHHLTSAIIHAINAALAYIALFCLTRQRMQSALVAAVFAVHPLRLESVAWVSERKDVLCATFYFLALICYAQYARTAAPARRGWYAGLIVSFALGIMAKPMVVTLPCVLLLLDFWPLKRDVRWGLLIEKTPLFAMSILSAVLTFVAQHWAGATGANANTPLVVRLGNAVWAYARYIKKTFWPNDLAVFYPYYGQVPGTSLPWGKVAISAIFLLAVSAIAIIFWRRGHRAVLVGWCWFLGVLVPTIGIVQVGAQSMADRYSYIPQVGLLIAIVWGADALLANRPQLRRAAAAAVAFASIAALSISCLVQLQYWRNALTLFQHALKVTDHNHVANMCVGMYLTTTDFDEAARYYDRALAIEPRVAEIHSNLGLMLRERGQFQRALPHLAKAVRINPKFAAARNNYANILVDLGRSEDAVGQFKEAIRLDPDFVPAYHNLGVTLGTLGRYQEAIPNFEKALRFRPKYLAARYAYVLALAKTGRLPEAKLQFEQVLAEKPDWTEAMQQFAWLMATSPNPRSRDAQAAIQLAEHANRLTVFDRPDLLDTLAAGYALAGQFDQAVAMATRAHDLAVARGNAAVAERISIHLDTFKRGKPYLAAPDGATTTTSPTR